MRDSSALRERSGDRLQFPWKCCFCVQSNRQKCLFTLTSPTLINPSPPSSISSSPSRASVPLGTHCPSLSFVRTRVGVGRGASSSRTSKILKRLARATTRLQRTCTSLCVKEVESRACTDGVSFKDVANSTPLGGIISCLNANISSCPRSLPSEEIAYVGVWSSISIASNPFAVSFSSSRVYKGFSRHSLKCLNKGTRSWCRRLQSQVPPVSPVRPKPSKSRTW
jgi:hypothetical protein